MDRYKCFYDYLSDVEIQSDNHEKVECWIEQLTSEGFEINEFAREILNEFGGVSVKGKGNTSQIFVELKFDPVYYASGEFERMGLYNFAANDTLFPVGGMFDFTVYVGKQGAFYVADWKTLYECGDTLERFLEIVSSEKPERRELLHTLTTRPVDFIDLHQTSIGGEKLQIFNKLYNRCLELLNNRNFSEELSLLLECWALIPGDKYSYDESYLVAWRVVQLAIETKNIPLMNEWKKHIALADPERADSGHREMLLGKIAYMNNNLQEAKELFLIADKKSEGRCFKPSDSKYRDFMLGKESKTEAPHSDPNIINEGDELDDNLHELITCYCEEGDRLFDDGLFDEALLEYDSAWGLLPEPKLKWDAASWIYAAKGDAYFFKGDYSNALPYFRGLYNQFEMINEFVLIRYGQCLYESGEIEKGKQLIFEAYTLGGKELFINENAKYFSIIENMV